MQKALQERHEEIRRIAASGVLPYLGEVVINSAGDPKPYREVAEPWQWTLASRLAPAIEAVAGIRKDYKGPRSFWITLPRGHDKTSLIGRLTSWSLAFSRYALRAIAAAADKEQANLILEFMQAEAALNPWLSPLLAFGNWKVTGGNGSRLKILAADDKSSFGLLEDIQIADELVWWSKRNLFDTIISGREKRPGSVFIVITNSGTLKSWQHEVFLAAQQDPDWWVYESPGRISNWLRADKIEGIRKLMPAPLARRVFDNVWIDENEDCGFISRRQAEACVDPALSCREQGVRGVKYVAAVDFGIVKDLCVMGVCHMTDDGEVVLDRMDTIQGSHEHRVPIQAVEAWIERVRRDFFSPTLILDLYQMESTAQRFDGLMEVERFESRGGKSNYEMAVNLRGMLINKRVRYYEGAGSVVKNGRNHDLVDELAELTIEMKSYGWRISHTASGHDDRAVMLAMACLYLAQSRGKTKLALGDRWF